MSQKAIFTFLAFILGLGVFLLSPSLYAEEKRLGMEFAENLQIVVNIPATKMTVYKNGKPIRHFKVAVGAPAFPTPVTKFHFKQIIWNPGWNPPDSPWAKNAKPEPPGPNNPLGPVKLPMQQAVLIHGTSKPWSIGHPASHGCIRMNSKDAIELGTFLQTELLPNENNTWENKYSKTRWQTVVKNLPKAVRVRTIYEPFELYKTELTLHPNFYGRKEELLNAIVEHLLAQGVYTAPLDLEKIKNLRATIKTNGAIVALEDLFYGTPDVVALNFSLDPICQVQNDVAGDPTLVASSAMESNF
ncbi:MAG: L,D-transpeptidase [Deltaproteobacteria bacterium]|nr:L,D-transpeptidase [Deltaproteobacteria bacterium]